MNIVGEWVFFLVVAIPIAAFLLWMLTDDES